MNENEKNIHNVFAYSLAFNDYDDAEALGSKTIERHNGESAYAGWTEVNGDITTF